jgi:hypothetical protein
MILICIMIQAQNKVTHIPDELKFTGSDHGSQKANICFVLFYHSQ